MLIHLRVKNLPMLFTMVFSVLLCSTNASAEISDRVVAFVDNYAVTMSELEEQYEATARVLPGVAREDVLATMINRLLIMKEAKKYRIEAASREEVMREFIDLKVRAFIKISENDIEEFYEGNVERFAGKQYEEVRTEIERYLTEREVNERLKGTIADLRKEAHVKIRLNPE